MFPRRLKRDNQLEKEIYLNFPYILEAKAHMQEQ
jgi:hypothetical protein